VLLPGDAEAPAERMLVAAPAAIDATVLKVPHHGSTTSSTAALLDRVRPAVAVFSVGGANPFGFPDPGVLARYRRLGVRLLRTDVDGSVLVWIDDRGWRVRSYAETRMIFCSALGAPC
jgi:competence protein ComEC